ncbi:alpha-D-ribose 1-methylphosphonate 5-triphosphate diphosphatase [Robbsia andropogonis]|uniref:alpha-D-ribose 1-methylphosphonate 5-triphosphate diphosphatase n=1 Tax=Robbsia andropogonis TaxID=28092 RepID=UPI000464210D|nr:alpha-D-ribose 1-methylphosphonate 5-triphosphate diphosphatase [Robbsia andropogonis]MCP1118096.1 alpha-D-ribose 1-methylphosphonate 5-triphosphate diphosphatase [Robbsia andropogonis]MCP1127623.1 alpha-D-ribose 1-methylphosphonate 5-triphosphate diphosphatase [Robbsia andropogonis]
MPRYYLHSARIVLPDTVLEDSALLIEAGRIIAIEPGGGGDATQIDLHGQMLLPGLVDLHCDAIEKEVAPRAGVMFPLDFAVQQIDRRNAAAGITTPFHAISFANTDGGVRDLGTATALVRALSAYGHRGLVDNRIHCRYEVTDAGAADILHMLLDERIIGLLSVMDHSPGQGQFRTVDAYVDYMCGNHALDRQTATAIAETKVAGREGALERMTALLEHATKTGIDVASHDDDSVARVAAMQKLGVRLTEFPIDAVTARAAVDAGMATILGAPNVMRGKSQSGAMRAIDAITAGTATCLCSDYQPSALLPAAFIAAQQAGLALHEAVALVTRNPATACGLHDRGRIAVGLRADLVALRLGNAWPTITQTWCEGRPVFSTQYPPSSAYVPVPSADDTDAQGASRFQSVVSTAEANLGSLTV